MNDPLALAVDGVRHGDIAAVPLVALAGAITSIGPCVAPRYVALAAVLNGPRRMLTVLVFLAGMLVAYATLGAGSGVLAHVTGNATVLDLLLCAVLIAAGLFTLLRPGHDHADAHAHPHEEELPPRRISAVFSLGAASAFVVSPCCTPVVAAVVGFAAADGSPFARVALLCAFAIGHAAPLLVLGATGSVFSQRLRLAGTTAAAAVVSGTLMLALGAYYGLLV